MIFCGFVVVVLAGGGWGAGRINTFGKFLSILLVVAPYAIEDMTISTISNISQFECQSLSLFYKDLCVV